MTREDDVEVKLALARQCGDEAKHYRLIEARLRELGVDPPSCARRGRAEPDVPIPAGLETTVERVAAGQFTREALALVQNQVFIELCEARGDQGTARLYRDEIQPDERHHHEMGRRLLVRLAVERRGAGAGARRVGAHARDRRGDPGDGAAQEGDLARAGLLTARGRSLLPGRETG